MAQEYLPAPSNVRLADLMKEHNISQPELAKEIGCSKSPIDLLKGAGVDMTSPAPVNDALALFGSLLDEMEKLAEER